MSQLAATHSSNRRALQIFIAVLSVGVIAAAATMLFLQQRYMLKFQQDEMRAELELLGEMATDSLLRNDYATVEALINRWTDRHDYIHEIRAIMPNGFVLAQSRKQGSPQEPLHVSYDIHFNGRTLATLNVTSDFSDRASGFETIVIVVTTASLLFILLLSWLLWMTLQRTALAPLQTQIRMREDKERELVQRTHELETTLTELETFSYSVSHDLRAPLRAIDGFSRILEEDYADKLDTEAKDYLQRVRKAVQRMGVLIDELLELSRVTRCDLTMTDVDMSTLAEQIMDDFKTQSPQRQISIDVEPGMTAQGDIQLLHAVLSNLLGNAWKYTSKKTSAHIEFKCIKQPGSPPLYCVRDNGIGFDMQYADKLFQPFQRLHSPQEFSGSGIGLATVARIIQRHGGQIWAEGQTGHGARFCFTLARSPATGETLKSGPQKPDINQL
jgi:signal transduction histidine kinase